MEVLEGLEGLEGMKGMSGRLVSVEKWQEEPCGLGGEEGTER